MAKGSLLDTSLEAATFTKTDVSAAARSGLGARGKGQHRALSHVEDKCIHHFMGISAVTAQLPVPTQVFTAFPHQAKSFSVLWSDGVGADATSSPD